MTAAVAARRRGVRAALTPASRHVRAVRKRPFVGDLSSSFGGNGNGVLAFLSTHSYVPAPPFAVRFAQVRLPPPSALGRAVTVCRLTPPPAPSQRPENSHLCLAVDEDGSVRIVDTAAPVRARPWVAQQPACACARARTRLC